MERLRYNYREIDIIARKSHRSLGERKLSCPTVKTAFHLRRGAQ